LISIISLGERMLESGTLLPSNFVLSLQKFILELKGLE
jgi:hypothetical protein